MKREISLLIFILLVSALACSTGAPAVPSQPDVSTIVAATMTAIFAPTSGSAVEILPTVPPTPILETPTQPAPTQMGVAISGLSISASGATFTIPNGLAGGALAETIAAANDPNIPIESYPSHIQFTLENYSLQAKFFEPRIKIFPARDFAQMSEGAAMNISELQNLLNTQGAPLPQNLPFLPMFNAAQVFHAQEKFTSFQNGSGIRYLTQYDQAPLPINNSELFYTFQGLTSDGTFYVSVILPVNASYLPADNNMNSPTPPDGVPMNWNNFEAFPQYMKDITAKINSTDPAAFTPALGMLDMMIESMRIANP